MNRTLVRQGVKQVIKQDYHSDGAQDGRIDAIDTNRRGQTHPGPDISIHMLGARSSRSTVVGELLIFDHLVRMFVIIVMVICNWTTTLVFSNQNWD